MSTNQTNENGFNRARRDYHAVGKCIPKKDSSQLLLGKPVFTDDITPRDALVIKLLTFSQGQFHFNPAILKVQTQWYQSIAFPLLQPDQFSDLLFVKQELSDAQRVFIVNIPLLIGIDMHLINENLAVVDIGKTFLQADFSGPDRFHFRP